MSRLTEVTTHRRPGRGHEPVLPMWRAGLLRVARPAVPSRSSERHTKKMGLGKMASLAPCTTETLIYPTVMGTVSS